MKRASISDVARRAGVSNATVSYALNETGRVAEATRKRVLQAAEELGFIRNDTAARLRTGRSNLIGVIINDIDNPFFNELVREFESSAWAAGYLTILSTSQDDWERQRRLIASLISQGVAGVMISPVHGSSPDDLRPLRDRAIPYLICVRDIGDDTSGFVGADDFEAGRIAARHLLDRGHRRFAFVGGYPRTATWRCRHGGIVSELEKHGPMGTVLKEFSGAEGHRFGFEVVRDIIARTDRPSAVIGFNDTTAIGAYLAAGEAGLQIGRDLSLVGIDNIPQAEFVQPGLTTVELFPRRMGRDCANALVARFATPDRTISRSILMPELVERGSVRKLP